MFTQKNAEFDSVKIKKYWCGLKTFVIKIYFSNAQK